MFFRCVANGPYLKTAEDSLSAAIELCQKHDLKGILAETYYCNGCVQLNLKGREKGRHFLLLARQLCIQVFGEFSILSFRIYHILGKTFEGRSEDKSKEYECSRRSWLIRRHTKGNSAPSFWKLSVLRWFVLSESTSWFLGFNVQADRNLNKVFQHY